jgi:hypothetical protein
MKLNATALNGDSFAATSGFHMVPVMVLLMVWYCKLRMLICRKQYVVWTKFRANISLSGKFFEGGGGTFAYTKHITPVVSQNKKMRPKYVTFSAFCNNGVNA